ncbi:hypothetical protein BSKO_09700 [Bryopsis sp. KO-2023]|nr:hypothetical protein BSKO_09700 [Bryopsis sp. KO-2023]
MNSNTLWASAKKVLFCCFDGGENEPTFELASWESKTGLGTISLTASVPHGPAAIFTPPPTVSLTATSPSSVSLPSSTPPPSTPPSSTIPQSRCPSTVGSQADRVGNVVDVNHLVADLMLDGARPTVGGAAHHEGDLAATLALLEGCCRGSIPQPSDSDYRRDLSHFTDPLTHHLPASYPRTRLPQFDDPTFYHHIDPLGFQPSGEPEATNHHESSPPADSTDWWYQSEDNFTLFSNQF